MFSAGASKARTDTAPGGKWDSASCLNTHELASGVWCDGDNSTKESIDNSFDQASISSYIENNSIFVGSVSILVSTDENYFPLNFDDLGDVLGVSDCTALCDYGTVT